MLRKGVSVLVVLVLGWGCWGSGGGWIFGGSSEVMPGIEQMQMLSDGSQVAAALFRPRPQHAWSCMIRIAAICCFGSAVRCDACGSIQLGGIDRSIHGVGVGCGCGCGRDSAGSDTPSLCCRRIWIRARRFGPLTWTAAARLHRDRSSSSLERRSTRALEIAEAGRQASDFASSRLENSRARGVL